MLSPFCIQSRVTILSLDNFENYGETCEVQTVWVKQRQFC